MAHCGNRKLYVQSRFTFYNLLPSTQPQTWWATTNKRIFSWADSEPLYDILWIMLSICSPVGTRHISRLFSARTRSWDSKNIPKLKCSMLAMFISNKMRPRSHPCQVPTHPHSSLWICECETWTWHLLSIKLKAPPSPFFTFPETSCVCVRNILGSPFN